MLDNALLYLSSAMLQVWAAILVYLVFKKRDLLANHRNELYQLWGVAKEWWHQPLRNMVDPNAPTLRNQLPNYGITELQVRTAEASIDSFTAVITAIKRHQLIVTMGKSFSDTAKLRPVSPNHGQLILDAIAEKVEQNLTAINTINSRDAMGGSFVGLVGNLLLLATLPLASSTISKGVLIAILGIGNLLLILSALEDEATRLVRRKSKS